MSAALRPTGSRFALAARRGRRAGFTLIEIMIVVVILGILAAIALPQLSSATAESRQAMLKDELRFLRNQLQVFRAQHRDVSAGYPGGNIGAAPDEATLLGHLTQYTDADGNISAVGNTTFKYPPYLSKMPENPISRKEGVWVVTGAALPAADQNQPYGWIYNPEINKVAANLEGTDLNNVPYAAY
jgi:prepilin-type N-terminal cleavage/methylation domain-containing protein